MSYVSVQSGEGIVLAVHGVTGGKGPASSITYDVLVTKGDGLTETYNGVKPATVRWADTVDTVAARPFDAIGWFFQGGKIYFRITEVADVGVCS